MIKEQPTYYAVIPASVRYDNELLPNSKLLYAEITALSSSKGICWASDDYFCKLYSAKRRTIQSWLKQLEDKGYITRQVIYKNGTKEIEKRTISIVDTLLQKSAVPYSRKMHNPTAEICVDNSTSINTTSKNSKDIVALDFKSVIDYLNIKTGKSYRLADTHKKLIRARYNEGYILEDFKKVIDNKVADWKDNKEFSKYLQPSTLFGNKFDSYLNQEISSKKQSAADEIDWDKYQS